MSSSFARNAIVLGVLSAAGPFAIDMYLPALPSIAADLDASTIGVQFSLMAFFGAVAMGQVVYGPLSDAFGRRNPLFIGFAIYTVFSVACAFAPSIEYLIAFRFLQGVGACAGMVIPRAVVRDLHTGHQAARMMSLIMLVFSVSPLLAPLSGSAIVQFFEWRGIFGAIAVLGVMSLIFATFFLKETRPPETRLHSGVGTIARNYLVLLRDRHFLAVTLIGGFGFASFFSYLSTSSFIYIEHFGLTPTQYSFAFAINAVAFIGMAQLTGRLGERFGLRRVVLTALSFYLFAASVLLILTLAGVDHFMVLLVMLFFAFGSLGLVMPSSAVLALEEYGPTSGTASALLGTIQMFTGASVMAVVGGVFGTSLMTLVGAVAFCSAAAFTFGRLALTRDRPAGVAAE